jgi:hypothetical protein
MQAILVVIIVILSRKIVEAKREGPKPQMDIVGALLSAIGVVALVAGALAASTYGWGTARQDFSIAGRVILSEGSISPVWLFIGIGVLVLIGFGWYMGYRERKGKDPLVHTRVLFNRVAIPGLVAQNIQWFLTLGVFFIVSVFLQVVFEYTAIQTGMSLLPAILGVLFFSRRAGKLAEKYSERRIIQTGFVVIMAGVLALLLMVDADGSALQLVPGLLLVGSGIGLVMPASVNLVQSAASEEDQGEISGVSRSASNLGSSLGVSIGGAVLVSVLIAGISQGTAESTVLPPAAKEQISVALEETVSAVSDTQLREALEGQPEEIREEVVRINAVARNRALAASLLTLGAFALIGLASMFFLPKQDLRSQAARG